MGEWVVLDKAALGCGTHDGQKFRLHLIKMLQFAYFIVYFEPRTVDFRHEMDLGHKNQPLAYIQKD